MVSDTEELRKTIIDELGYYSDKEKEKREQHKQLLTILTKINDNITKLLNMNAARKPADTGTLTQQELLTEIIHRLKHLEKGQQAIKSHLWKEKTPEGYKGLKEIIHQKAEAINYINNVVMPDIEAAQAQHEGEIGTQGLVDWAIGQVAKPVAEYLKTQALIYIGQALDELKSKAIPYAVQAADWILERLENIIIKQYENASQEQQEQFKANIEKHFPNSRLLGKL